MAATYQQQLDACNNAILLILKGGVASYTDAGIAFENLSLKDLREMRKELERLVAEEEAGGGAIFRDIVRGD